MVPTVETLFAFARSIRGEDLATSHRKKPFKVEVVGNTLEFTPGSSRQARIESREHVEAILATLTKSGSLQPAQYADASFNASYVLALIQRWRIPQV